MKAEIFTVSVVFGTTFIITAIILRWLIPILRSKKMGQKILDIGPRWHKDKEGTPTMGGIAFISACLVVLTVFCMYKSVAGENVGSLIFTLLYAVSSALIGITDDLNKLKKKQNEGLTAIQKYTLQLICSAVYIIAMRYMGYIDTVVGIPFTDYSFDLGVFYYIFALLFLTGFNNAVNLTDGIDGLCSGVTAIVSLYFGILGLKNDAVMLELLAFAVLGGCLGFLVYNYHPAKVFMGDTGSLFLGAAVSGMAIMSENELILFLIGAVYVLETVSVILQVLWYKMTKKRLFLMAPFHHHLEKKRWSEVKITLIAAFVTFLISVVLLVN